MLAAMVMMVIPMAMAVMNMKIGDYDNNSAADKHSDNTNCDKYTMNTMTVNMMTVLTMLVAIMLMMIMAMLIKVTGIDRR